MLTESQTGCRINLNVHTRLDAPLRNTQQNAREQQILDLATEMIIKEGTAALTMEKLASKLPFSKGTLYNHSNRLRTCW
jgi:hypothetical protein